MDGYIYRDGKIQKVNVRFVHNGGSVIPVHAYTSLRHADYLAADQSHLLQVYTFPTEGQCTPMPNVFFNLSTQMCEWFLGVTPFPTVPTVPPLPTVPTVPPLPTVPTVPPLPTVPTVPTVPPLPTVPTVPTVPPLPTVPTVPPLPTVPSFSALPPAVPDAPPDEPAARPAPRAARGAPRAAPAARPPRRAAAASCRFPPEVVVPSYIGAIRDQRPPAQNAKAFLALAEGKDHVEMAVIPIRFDASAEFVVSHPFLHAKIIGLRAGTRFFVRAVSQDMILCCKGDETARIVTKTVYSPFLATAGYRGRKASERPTTPVLPFLVEYEDVGVEMVFDADAAAEGGGGAAEGGYTGALEDVIPLGPGSRRLHSSFALRMNLVRGEDKYPVVRRDHRTVVFTISPSNNKVYQLFAYETEHRPALVQTFAFEDSAGDESHQRILGVTDAPDSLAAYAECFFPAVYSFSPDVSVAAGGGWSMIWHN